MAAKKDFTQAGFVKSYVLPLLITFLIPAFGWWFFDHVEAYFDRMVRESSIAQIEKSLDMPKEKRERAISFFENNPASKIMASSNPEVKKFQEAFSDLQFRYAIFRWMKRTSLLCIGSAIFALIAAAIGLRYSSQSQNALYLNLRIGWNILRLFALIQVIGQGALAMALSFWITAFWFEFYSAKLIVIICALAIGAIAMLIQAIFRKLPEFMEFEGTLVTKEAAPALWQRVTEMAGKLGIAPPDQIFVGIDDNFFVTEHTVKVGDKTYQGRTLFASISLLKTMSRSEADAVLAHELAHFSGDDTLYSKRISPLLGKYLHYLQALYQGGISRPVFHFMFFFWNLYQFAINKLSREREFRADRIGGELTTPQSICRSLIKVAAYCQYRGKVQENLFGTDAKMETMNVFQQIEQGFPKFMSESLQDNSLANTGTPHPFDTHPPLESRLKNMGFELKDVLKPDEPLPVQEETWFSSIEGAADLEAKKWKEFEDKFQEVHQLALAWRFKPEGETEISHVVKFFPEIQFAHPKKDTKVTFDYEKVHHSDWEVPIFYSTIKKCQVDDVLGGKQLTIEYNVEGDKTTYNRKFKFQDLKKEGADFISTLQNYYGRYLTAKEHHEQKNAPKTDAETAKEA